MLDRQSEPCPYCGGVGCLPCRGRGTVGLAFRANRGLPPYESPRLVEQRQLVFLAEEWAEDLHPDELRFLTHEEREAVVWAVNRVRAEWYTRSIP